MRLGDLLVRAKLVTEEQVAKALDVQALKGGRLGDHLVAAGVLTRAALDAFLHRMPAEPANVAATGLEVNDLLSLLMKLIYKGRLESVRQFVEAIKLPSLVVMEVVRMAVDRKLLYTSGLRNSESSMDMNYALTEEGRRWTLDALQLNRYAGPAPVTLEEFTHQVNLQKLSNELVTFERIREAIRELSFEDSFIEQTGPALNSGRAILLYGPPGNGKTSVALRLANAFNDVIYMPYAVIVDGQIITVHDARIHAPLHVTPLTDEKVNALIRRTDYDARWVPCKRPFVVAGGELTMEMLDLRYDESSHLYEAPLHMKALGGCFVIDDFGRQLLSPVTMLNRWIVPLESRVDFLKLHTGNSFSIPFDELVIFSTNLEPDDLMDPALLRRIPYKIRIGAPSLELYKRIFLHECETNKLTLTDEMFDGIVRRVTREKGLELAAFHPKFILDQVVASCRFLGKPVQLEPRFVEYAIDNLAVKRETPKTEIAA